MNFYKMRMLDADAGASGSGQQGAGADGNGAQSSAAGTPNGNGTPNNAGTQNGSGTVDYDKLASIIAGKQSVAEDQVLKGYFKQQGLSQEEMNQAIAAFKAEKAKNTPDPAALQAQLASATAAVQAAQIESTATIAAVSLGLDSKSIPYVIKLADMSTAIGTDGKLNSEAVTAALQKVLEDVPALKPQAAGATGFRLGASGEQGSSPQGGAQPQQNNNSAAVPSKKWNRFNI